VDSYMETMLNTDALLRISNRDTASFILIQNRDRPRVNRSPPMAVVA
jgi:hypothetical protein